LRMKTTTLALILLVLEVVAVVFIGFAWYRYYKDILMAGGELSDGIFGVVLVLASIYYPALIVWTLFAYRGNRDSQQSVNWQLGIIMILCVSPFFLFFSI